MKKTAKWAGLVVATTVCVTSVAFFAACDNDNQPQTTAKQYTVTYYDGSEVLKEEKVKEGEKATRWTPEKDDYVFVDWYAVPNSTTFKFDFDAPITENKSAFSVWTSANQSEDTREYYIVGAGTSPILSASNWGKLFDETTKMTKTEGKNEYKYTVDLYEGDEFQFALNADWHNQRGFGYLDSLKLADGTAAFSGAATIGDNAAYRLNIKCEYSGNYTFTLTTHPDDDTYETTHPSYTEEGKEAFNINPLDSITWVRNGDISAAVEVITDIYIKGATITNWLDVYTPATKMTNTDGVYTLEVYLKSGEEFMFTSLNTIGTTEPTAGTLYVRGSNLDEAGKQYVEVLESANMKTKAAGTYTFTYNFKTGVLSVTFDADKTNAAYDYYLDGSYGGGAWGDFMNDKAAHKLTETAAGSGVYKISGVELAADDELVIRAYAAGEEELTWNNGAYNYNSVFLVGGGDNVAQASATNANMKVLVSGTYDITIDSYSKIVSFEKSNVADWVYIVSSASGEGGWKVAEDYKMSYNAANGVYSVTLSLAENEEFGVRVMQGESTTQRYWFASGQVDGTAPEGILVSGSSNIKCTAAGTYTITLTVTDGTGAITVTKAE